MAERKQNNEGGTSDTAAKPSGFPRWKTLMAGWKAMAESRSALPTWFQDRLVFCLCLMLVVLVAVFGAVMVPKEPELAIRIFGATDKFEILQFVGIAMGGVVLAIQAATAHKRARALEAAALAQAKAASAQARANENTETGQRQERLKTAIEHLGHRAVSVRLGGAYELSHLAADNEDLRQTVLHILCAHIRQTTGEAAYRATHKEKPSEEIQALLTLLFVERSSMVFKDCFINLQGSCLNGANVEGAWLREADLKRVSLQHAKLYNADMGESFLMDANLNRADLREAHLDEAKLWNANLYEARLSDAHLRGTDLLGAHLLGAKLERATLICANLHRARLQGADLTCAKLYGANLQGAQLQATVLIDTALQETNLEDTNMGGTGSQHNLGSFEERIRAGVEQLTAQRFDAVFEGGLRQEDVNEILNQTFDPTCSKTLKMELQRHVGAPKKRTLPAGSRAITGAYTADEAEQWIAEYLQALEGGLADHADGHSEGE